MVLVFLIDLFDNYQNAKIRQYKENFDNKYQLQLEFAADVYNGHLIFTSTTKDVHSSILMLFILKFREVLTGVSFSLIIIYPFIIFLIHKNSFLQKLNFNKNSHIARRTN